MVHLQSSSLALVIFGLTLSSLAAPVQNSGSRRPLIATVDIVDRRSWTGSGSAAEAQTMRIMQQHEAAQRQAAARLASQQSTSRASYANTESRNQALWGRGLVDADARSRRGLDPEGPFELVSRSKTAQTALEEQQKHLDVIANNIANANTPGYEKEDKHKEKSKEKKTKKD